MGGLGPSPHLHPKSMESLLESVQADILDDLNNLGRYSRYYNLKFRSLKSTEWDILMILIATDPSCITLQYLLVVSAISITRFTCYLDLLHGPNIFESGVPDQ